MGPFRDSGERHPAVRRLTPRPCAPGWKRSRSTGRPWLQVPERGAHEPAGDSEDMVGPVCFLLSSASAMVTGLALPVDGGNLFAMWPAQCATAELLVTRAPTGPSSCSTGAQTPPRGALPWLSGFFEGGERAPHRLDDVGQAGQYLIEQGSVLGYRGY